MSKSLLHDWESSIEKNKNNTEELLKIAEDIYNTAYARGKASTERPQGEWIPVSERLPEEKVAVLVYVSTGTSKTFCLANWNNFYGGWEDWLSDKLIEKELGYKVIAWQPLPEPYMRGGAE